MKKFFLLPILFGLCTLSASANSVSKRLELIQRNLEFDKDQFVHLLSFEELNSRLLRVSVVRGGSGQISLLLKGPEHFWKRGRYPVLFVSSGFEAGAHSIELIQTDFDVVLVSMDYSVTKNDLQRDPSLLLKMIRLTPGQIVAALQWVQEQNWYNKALGLHYMGISLGTLFMPVSISLAQKNGLFMSSSIFGFGGADIGKIFEHHLTPYLGQESSSRVKRIVEMIIALYDPKIYLSELGGPNLLIFATNDQIFPPSSVEKLIQLTPNPKEVVWINGQHIDVDRPEIISATIQTVVRWLRKQIPL